MSPRAVEARDNFPAAIQTPAVIDWSKVHDVSRVHTLVTNWGLVGSKPGGGRPYSDAPAARWPARSQTEYLWAGGFWIGAIKNGEPRVTTAEPEEEFRPGHTELDRIYVTQAGAPGGARRPSPDADDDHDGKQDEDRLDGRDNDGDARIDEDFAAISNQMFACEYNDTDPAIRSTYPDHVPLEVLVQQTSLVWTPPLYQDIVGFDLKIINRGFDPLDEVYVGFYADCDIGIRGTPGLAQDDRAGFWEGLHQVPIGLRDKIVKTSLGYMLDADTDNGASEGYIGFVFLGASDSEHRDVPQHPMALRNFRMFSGTTPFSQGGDPTSDAERYQVLAGTAPRSLPPPENGRRAPQLATQNNDYRILVSVGPFETVAPGDTVDVQMAMVLGRFFDGVIESAVVAQLLYDGVWFDCDGDPTTGVLGRETPVCGPAHAGEVLSLDACDSTCALVPPPDPSCYVQVPPAGCAWINADCDVERQTEWVTGIEGKECAIHWTTERTVPVSVQGLAARSDVDGVRLMWKLERAALNDVVAVRVMRAEDAEGPYVALEAPGLVPTVTMSFDDVAVEGGRTYWYRIVVETNTGEQQVAASIRVTAATRKTITALDVPEQRDASTVQLGYTLGRAGPVDLTLFDALGHKVRTLYRGRRDAGSYASLWDCRAEDGVRPARGIYLLRLDAGRQQVVRKLVLVRE